ncbi:MAG: amidohydrolase family protein [Ornithinimicrobium sp.]
MSDDSMRREHCVLLHNAHIYPGRAPAEGAGASEHHGSDRVDVPPGELTAMLTRGAEILWVGTEEDYLRATDDLDEAAGDQLIDCGGALLTPAFCDAHVHLTMTGQGLDGIDLSATTSVGEALRLIESAARHTRGRPIYAHSWDETRWVEHRPVTARELDRATYGGVVYMPRIDAHSASVSSAMAAVARVHGLDGWDGDGVVTREAFAAVTNAFTSAMTPDDREHYLDLALRAAAERGIGLIHETGAEHLTSFDDVHHVLEAGTRAGRPQTVAYWGLLVDDPDQAGELQRHLGVRGLAGDLCADGSFGSRTAHLRQPYLDGQLMGTGVHSFNRGYGYLDGAQISSHVVACTRAGLQAGGHVIGDAALETMAEGFRAAAAVVGVEAMRAAKHRWEHVELPTDAVIQVMTELGIWASVQPAFDAAWGGTEGMYAARLGHERALAAIPLRSLLDAGISLALGSDSPVTPFDPWGGVRAAMWHHNPAQRLTVEEAFHAHSAAGYELGGVEGGYLAAGGPATYVLWEDAKDAQASADSSGLPLLDEDTVTPIARRTVVQGAVAFERAPMGETG